MKDSYSLNINQEVINSENYAKLLGVEIDNKLSFEIHIYTIVKKASNQLNAIIRIQQFMGFKEKFCKIALSIQTLITVPSCGICSQQNQ